MKTLSINQPANIPWAGYFDRIAKSDVHIILDHVQFEKNSLINRNYIASKFGPQLLTIPVLHQGEFQKLSIKDARIDLRSRWAKKHLKSIQQNYSKSKFYNNFIPKISELYAKFENIGNLTDVLFETNSFILEHFKVKTQNYKSSDFSFSQKKSDLILEICEYFDCEIYLSGPMGRNYLNLSAFKKRGIRVEFHDYRPHLYRSEISGFNKHLSILDIMFHCDNYKLDGGLH